MVKVFAMLLVMSALAEEHAPKKLTQETMSPHTIERLKHFIQDACGAKRPGPPPSRTPADPIAPVQSSSTAEKAVKN